MPYDKIVDSTALDSTLRDIAEAIRGKTGKNEPLTIDQMAAEITGIQAGTGGADLLVEGNLTEYTGDVRTVRDYAFYGCKDLTSVYLPSAIRTYSNAFANCLNLTNVDMPAIEQVASNTFNACRVLEVLDLHQCRIINADAFRNCTNLRVLILRRTDAVCSIASVDVFKNTPFAADGSGGLVYVPENLIKEYEFATNWSTLMVTGNIEFVEIEGSEYE